MCKGLAVKPATGVFASGLPDRVLHPLVEPPEAEFLVKPLAPSLLAEAANAEPYPVHLADQLPDLRGFFERISARPE